MAFVDFQFSASYLLDLLYESISRRIPSLRVDQALPDSKRLMLDHLEVGRPHLQRIEGTL